jgi:autotransporter translocation and assembly factor TamB
MRVVRRLVHVLLIVLTLVVGAAAAAIIVSQTAWFKNWLRGYIVREANLYLNGTLSIERLGGSLFFGIEMENIGVSMDGSQVVAVRDLGLEYNVFELVTRGLSVANIRLDKPVVYLRREGDTWTLSRLVKKQQTEADRSGPNRPVSIDEIGISDGAVVIDGAVGTSGVEVPKRFEHLDAKLAFKYEPVRYSIEITHVSFRGSEPALALNALSGGVAVREDTVYVEKLALRTAESSILVDGAVQHYLTKPVFNLQISSDKLSIPEIARLVPALSGVRVQPAFEVRTEGPLDRFGVSMNVRSSAGRAVGTFVADVLAPGQSVAGTLSVRHLDLSALLNDPKQKSDLNADARVDVRAESFADLDSLRGSMSLDSPRVAFAGYAAGPIAVKARLAGRRVDLDARASAYGASATAAGRVTLPDPKQPTPAPIAFDLKGRARRIDLRRLPRELNVPPAATDVNAAYHVAGRVTPTGAAADGAKPTPARANLRADFRFEPSSIAGAAIADGSTAGVTLAGAEVGYSADATVSHLDLQRIGRELQVPALAVDRYKSDVNAHLIANGRGTKPESMDVTANGELTETSILGGTISQLSFEGGVADDTVHAKANGTLSGFDPALVSGRPTLKGTVGGTVDVDATIDHVSRGISPDGVQATAKVNLEPSTIAGLDISRASVDGDYRDSTGDVRTLEIVGRDLNVRASGTIALNDTGQSNLKLHADSPSLATIGQLVDQPLTGIGSVDATITGNRRELQASGNITGDGVKYQNNGALTASTDFTARVPDLDAARASVSATTHATFVALGGQNINQLDAKTDYTNKELDFDVNAKQPQRTLAAGGSLLLRPDDQEVRLRRLALTSQGVQWQSAPGSEATIQYGGSAIAVRNFRLTSGNQQIAADGAFGRAGDELKVTLTNVDVATIDALLLRPPQLSGRLNAEALVHGTKDAPGVRAQFTVSQGGFKQFKYDTFGGTVDYVDKGVTVDARLQQNPTTFVEARGYAPIAEDATRNQYDLHVQSTPIDLGVVQGFTTAVTGVTGTVQAKVDISGAAGDPRPTGAITVDKAAFTVAPTGVKYSELDGRIELQPDKVHIDELRLLDNQRKPLTVTGDLAIHEREIGGVSIAVKADDFKVIDNQMGNVRIRSDVRLAGELTAPRVEGNLGITTGTVNLDPILAQVGDSAYATKETEFATAPADAQGQTPPPSAFDALQMDLRVTVPDDLVIKSNDLRAADAPISMGALNITLGGDLWVGKTPYDQIRIVGPVRTIRGTYDFQGRRFTILRDGTVRFEGTDDLDPALDLRTERVIQAVTARVDVRGTLKQPEIALSSTPPLEQADILSLIVFNQPINQLGEGQQISLAQRAQSMAIGAAAGQLAQSIGSALNLQTFEINMAPENGGGPELAIGQQLGQNLYVKVEQGIGDASQTNFILEYELTKWLRFRTNVLQGSSTQAQLFQRMQGSGADLLFFFSY